MADMCHVLVVGWATSISEVHVILMLCTWRSGGMVEGGEEGGESEGLHG